MLSSIITMVLIGVFTGIVTGLTGVSGVMVVVPLINLLLNFSVHKSIGTSLMVDVIAPPTHFSYVRKKYIRIKHI